MECSVCHKEFGNGGYCQNCGTDRITGLANYHGFPPADNNGAGIDYYNSGERTMVCYACGKVIPADSKFCPVCSKELFVTCPKCGHEYSSQYPACNKCGTNRVQFEQQRLERERIAKEERIRKEKEQKIREEKKREEERRIAEEKREIEYYAVNKEVYEVFLNRPDKRLHHVYILIVSGDITRYNRNSRKKRKYEYDRQKRDKTAVQSCSRVDKIKQQYKNRRRHGKQQVSQQKLVKISQQARKKPNQPQLCTFQINPSFISKLVDPRQTKPQNHIQNRRNKRRREVNYTLSEIYSEFLFVGTGAVLKQISRRNPVHIERSPKLIYQRETKQTYSGQKHGYIKQHSAQPVGNQQASGA
jgi:hypothetical protein